MRGHSLDNKQTTEFTGPNLAYILGEYQRYQEDPKAVTQEFRDYFTAWIPSVKQSLSQGDSVSSQEISVSDAVIEQVIQTQAQIRDLRDYGHLLAHTNPLSNHQNESSITSLTATDDGLNEGVLSQIPARWVWDNAPTDCPTASAAILDLKAVYTGDLGFDFAHVHVVEEQAWLRREVERRLVDHSLSRSEQTALLQQLIEVDAFEQFLQRTFVGQKRFSIEGVDMLVPMLRGLISRAVAGETEYVMIGMAHRGRLNTLAHVLGKPYEDIFSEFHTSVNKDLVPSEGSMGINFGWTGDVKYHLGANNNLQTEGSKPVRLVLANNPSHLEFVNPVVEGFTRAAQDNRHMAGAPLQNRNRAVAILVHGDAAFPGEGIVAETLNLSNLSGYETGGTIHIIANNQLGFTADASEGRSTRYASDLARGFEIPIVHVSADNPEACMKAVTLAYQYRQKFHKDFLINLIGYRRWGHNEMDDPVPTQPKLYQIINNHPRLRDSYGAALTALGVVTESQVTAFVNEIQTKLKAAYDALKQGEPMESEPSAESTAHPSVFVTGVSLQQLERANDGIFSIREGFAVYKKLQRVLNRRSATFHEDRIDWAHAEELAFATILMDGTPIRMTGQDTERGTFSQRHLVLHDEHTGERDCPLERLSGVKASFAVHNSPLSEAGVLGFEYGYDVHATDALVIWEAQFGDFANAAQVIIDQFLASGLAKWRQTSGLVLLLPHGYEGQGPEHSSARLERYLELSAQNNWRVVYPTTASQYFHLLRSQAAMCGTDSRPLIVMTPKSLLRNPRVVSARSELTNGSFRSVLFNTGDGTSDAVRRLVMSSGKIAVNLDTALFASQDTDTSWLRTARLEQLYPFPTEELQMWIHGFRNLEEVMWLQEEPENMGAWRYVKPLLEELLPGGVRLLYRGRTTHASPAEGSAKVHQKRQDEMIHGALTRHVTGSMVGTGGMLR